jgi:hypothetical protein
MSKPDTGVDADVEKLSDLLANGVFGLVAFGLTNGLELKQLLDRITKSKKNMQLVGQLVRNLCLRNPVAANYIEKLAAVDPKLAAFFERVHLKAKDATPDDPDVKEAEPC